MYLAQGSLYPTFIVESVLYSFLKSNGKLETTYRTKMYIYYLKDNFYKNTHNFHSKWSRQILFYIFRILGSIFHILI